jgi:siroheme synthase
MVITGNRAHDLQSPQWQAAAALVKAGGTLVVLMGLSHLREIIGQLVSDGCNPGTPAALISRGTYLIQDCRTGTLGDILNGTDTLKPPGIIVVGEVVALRNQIHWMDLAAKLYSDDAS